VDKALMEIKETVSTVFLAGSARIVARENR
jgi:hypothetical protein